MAIIPMSDVLDHQLLPIDAQDIVTKVRLVIAGNRAGGDPTYFYVGRDAGDGSSDGVTLDYYPRPVVFEYEAPEHATYGCERSLALPENSDPFLPPEHPSIPEPSVSGAWVNPGSPSAVRDGDPLTKATVSGSGAISYSNIVGGVGFKIRFKATRAGAFYALDVLCRNQRGASSAQGFVTFASVKLLSEEVTDRYLVLPPDARNETENTPDLDGLTYRQTIFLSSVTGTEAEVVHFYPLVLNTELLENIAKANIRLPGMSPRRVTVRGVVPPDRVHTITGWPGGDYAGFVAQHQYDLLRGEAVTIIDFEQAGPPVGLPAEAVEAERVRVARTTASIDRATYGLKMGERQ